MDRVGLGAERAASRRIEVSFVRELAPQVPPGGVPGALRPVRGLTARTLSAQSLPTPEPLVTEALPPEPAASAAPLAPRVASSTAPLPAEPRANDEQAALASPAASAAVAAALTVLTEAAGSAPAATLAAVTAETFDWPPSTRLSYRVSGNYRGPVEGQAQVEWLRSGTRYQVHMDLSIGPSFAPLMSRRVSSEGEITPAGLSPRRYDELTKVVLREPRQLSIQLNPDSVRLANGAELPRPAGVQDSASQFVQITWMFTTQPGLLQAGRSLELPLALPRRLANWTYDVIGAEMLATPAGQVETWHVKPRPGAQGGAELSAEIWVAPSLQYLPVRIVIRQDAQNFLDLLIERLPQQAAPGR